MYQVETIYSPKVSGLWAQIGYKTATLSWTNPEGDLAKKILVSYDGQEMVFDEMISTITLNDLLIKGYEISVYTIDGFGNRSVPSNVYIFPSGEEQQLTRHNYELLTYSLPLILGGREFKSSRWTKMKSKK